MPQSKNTKKLKARKKPWFKTGRVPLYTQCHFYVGVGEGNEIQKLATKAIRTTENPEYDWAFCGTNGSHIGVFFNREALTYDVIAHECYHAAYRIADYTAWKFKGEPAAYLLGYLTKVAFQTIIAQGEKILG